eukprot:g3304.t1
MFHIVGVDGKTDALVMGAFEVGPSEGWKPEEGVFQPFCPYCESTDDQRRLKLKEGTPKELYRYECGPCNSRYSYTPGLNVPGPPEL